MFVCSGMPMWWWPEVDAGIFLCYSPLYCLKTASLNLELTDLAGLGSPPVPSSLALSYRGTLWHPSIAVCNSSAVWDRDRRIAGVCWLPAWLQLQRGYPASRALVQAPCVFFCSPVSACGPVLPSHPYPSTPEPLGIWCMWLMAQDGTFLLPGKEMGNVKRSTG